MIGEATLFKSLWAARRAALEADVDCSRGEAAETAVLRVSGSFNRCPIQRLIGRASENLGLRPEITRCRGPRWDGAYAWLDEMTDDQINALFDEVDRTLTIKYPRRGGALAAA